MYPKLKSVCKAVVYRQQNNLPKRNFVKKLGTVASQRGLNCNITRQARRRRCSKTVSSKEGTGLALIKL
jgi:hypothetical protein